MVDASKLSPEQEAIVKNYTTLNLGPTHPATHGIFQNILTMDGENVVDSEQTVGYIHRAFEKIAEQRTWYQITPLTDRLNYCSSPINNIGYQLAVEKLFGVETSKRIDYMRVIIMELSRISDHLICRNANLFTKFSRKFAGRALPQTLVALGALNKIFPPR
jgi:NADH-quinone oxidoreductase subunit D